MGWVVHVSGSGEGEGGMDGLHMLQGERRGGGGIDSGVGRENVWDGRMSGVGCNCFGGRG